MGPAGDRVLEVRDLRVMTSLEIWIYEDDRPIVRHSALSLRETVHALGQAATCSTRRWTAPWPTSRPGASPSAENFLRLIG